MHTSTTGIEARRILGISLALLLCVELGTAGTTWYVDVAGNAPGTGTQADPYTSIQFAISRPSTVDGDQVEVRPGVYVENLDFLGKAIQVSSTFGPGITIIDGGGVNTQLTAVTFQSGEGAGSVLEGFTVTNGWGTLDGTGFFYEGGGILMDGASPTIGHCWIQFNEGEKGGGILGRDASPVIHDCQISSNNQNMNGAQVWGGGARFEGGSPTLVDTDVSSNFAYGGGGGLYFEASSPSLLRCAVENNGTAFVGGGVYLSGPGQASITDSSFRFNVVSDDEGAGLYLDGATVTMTGCTVEGNEAQNDHEGGGLQLESGSLDFRDGFILENDAAQGGGIVNRGSMYLENTAICSNTVLSPGWGGTIGGNGAGLYDYNGGVVAFRCTFDGNQAFGGLQDPGWGGAVWGQSLLVNCTIVSNSALSMGGVYDATLENCIHWFNQPPESNLITVTYTNFEGGMPGVGNISLDPMLWDPFGGDYHLKQGSPCIDTGDPNSPPDPDGTQVDMGAIPFDAQYPAVNYCTAGTSASGCQASISSAGVPSASLPLGFELFISNVEGNKDGLFYYGANGQQANPWGNGTSYQCVLPPVSRAGLLQGSGTQGLCDGAFSQDLNLYWSTKPSKNPGAGAVVQAQFWYRDPQNTSNQTTSLSDALEFPVAP